MKIPTTAIGPGLILLVVLLALGLAGCESEPSAHPEADSADAPPEIDLPAAADGEAPAADDGGYDPERDYFSYANRDGMTVRHLELDLDVDFERQELRGHAVLHVELTDPNHAAGRPVPAGGQTLFTPDEHGAWEASGASSATPSGYTLTLDQRDLAIDGVWIRGEDGAEHPLAYGTGPGEPDPIRGGFLTVTVPEDRVPEDRFEIRIAYRTAPGASAIMWLPPELTAGGKHPFLFTQSQSIHARSWVPLQDTPAVRFTYEAVIRTPPELLAVMSADNDPQASRDGEYHFSMPQPIPSYLLALAVGDLDFASFGDRTGVYAEPAVLPAAAAEFAETEAMLEAAETLWGPYEWGRYDLLILPPSFPYGGMENPRLSFLTPSLIAGDRSLTSTVAHELAHSWSGNLVSNATWRDIWLNEGMTNYLEARLMEVIYDRDRADEERLLNYQDLVGLLETVPEDLQPLAPRFDSGDPDVGQDGLEYRKGQLLLGTLEHHFTRPVFDVFLKDYFRNFAWQAITSEQFLDYTDRHLLTAYPGIYPRERLEAWLYRPGIPADAVVPTSPSLERAGNAATAWAAGQLDAGGLEAESWSPMATVHFLQSLPEDLTMDQLAELDAALGLSATGNAEIARSWFTRAATWRYLPAYRPMREYLERYGRIRLLRPVYQALAANGEDLGLAREIFESARPNYHPLTIAAIEPLLKVETPPTIAARTP